MIALQAHSLQPTLMRGHNIMVTLVSSSPMTKLNLLGHMLVFLTKHNVLIKCTAHHSSYQNGVVERHIQTVKAVVIKLNNEFPQTAPSVLFMRTITAINNRPSASASCPSQVLFGRAPRLPSTLDDTISSLDQTYILADQIFAERNRVLFRARAALAILDSNEKFRRALARSHRADASVVAYGDVVLYFDNTANE